MEAPIGGSIPAILFGWFGVVYIAYIAAGSLPREDKPARRKPRRVLLDRLIFSLAAGFAPAVFLVAVSGIDPTHIGLGSGVVTEWLPFTIVLGAAGFAVGFLARKSLADLASYPQYLPLAWTPISMMLEAGSWALYLLAYEFAFRGYLLASLLPLGAPAAISIATTLYSVAHLPKSAREAIGAIPFGVVASLLALRYGTFIPAFIIHLALALGNDAGTLRAAHRAVAIAERHP
jgi:hypothetical protein